MVALLTRADRPVIVASFGRAAGVESPAGWIASLRRSKTGVLLSPASTFDGSIFGGRLSAEKVFSGPPGRAVAGYAGGVEIVQIPLYEG
jgi:S-DNA-T family DNA segregation ATPase FtsK/SpoIIIE